VTSGIRIGSPAMTTRGFKELESGEAGAPDRRRAGCAGRRRGDRARGRRVKLLCDKFPVYGA